MSDDMDIVPFGKYKGQPIANLISDRNYTDWLAAQPWFRERFGNVYNLIINQVTQPQDTPEHNAMQARFLDHDEILRVALVGGLPRQHIHEIDTWIRQRNRLPAEQKENLDLCRPSGRVFNTTFECAGWDLIAGIDFTCNVVEKQDTCCICTCSTETCQKDDIYQIQKKNNSKGLPVPDLWSTCIGWRATREKHCNPECRGSWIQYGSNYEALYAQGPSIDGWLAIELKPTLGDDYPSVLRTATKRREDWGRTGPSARIVIADHVEFGGDVTLGQVRKIYRSQSVRLITTAELPPIEDPWRCSCAECRAENSGMVSP